MLNDGRGKRRILSEGNVTLAVILSVAFLGLLILEGFDIKTVAIYFVSAIIISGIFGWVFYRFMNRRQKYKNTYEDETPNDK